MLKYYCDRCGKPIYNVPWTQFEYQTIDYNPNTKMMYSSGKIRFDVCEKCAGVINAILEYRYIEPENENGGESNGSEAEDNNP